MRAALIAAGRELIEREGLMPVSLRQIAKHAHYSPAVVYRYFPDKDALFLAIRDEGLAQFADEVEALIERTATAEATLRAIAEAGFSFAVEQSAAFGMNMLTVLWMHEEGAGDGVRPVRDLSPPGGLVHRLYERAVRALFEELGAPPVPAAMAVATLMSAITGAVALPSGSAYGDFPDRRAVMRNSVDMLLAGWRAVAEQRAVLPLDSGAQPSRCRLAPDQI